MFETTLADSLWKKSISMFNLEKLFSESGSLKLGFLLGPFLFQSKNIYILTLLLLNFNFILPLYDVLMYGFYKVCNQAMRDNTT